MIDKDFKSIIKESLKEAFYEKPLLNENLLRRKLYIKLQEELCLLEQFDRTLDMWIDGKYAY